MLQMRLSPERGERALHRCLLPLLSHQVQEVCGLIIVRKFEKGERRECSGWMFSKKSSKRKRKRSFFRFSEELLNEFFSFFLGGTADEVPEEKGKRRNKNMLVDIRKQPCGEQTGISRLD